MIRDAVDDDWTQIYPIFAAVVEAGETYAFPEGLSADEARPWWMDQSSGRTVVAAEGDLVLGSAKMGPNRPGRGAHIGTASFMIDVRQRGRGIGRALAVHMIEWSRQQGFAGIQFNAVVETNLAAVALWTSLGFAIVGTVPGAFDHASQGRVGLHVMYLEL
ncbi:GNAT family N-acetyltransferase [Aeromicrobium sp. A1-2]|uniref:GNAT family N-acetyltransferase n=1 Tax=Aeromicrobium sp. A1-2 TaxID=2107713 RepID=UPI0020B1354D